MLLNVNIDCIISDRNVISCHEPDIYDAALIIKKTCANGIITPLREDRCQITDENIDKISKIKGIKLCFEMAATDEMQKIALKYKPHACSIVAEKRNEIATEEGLNVAGKMSKIISFIGPLLHAGINVSLLIAPEFEQIEAAANTGVKFIELHTGSFANAFGTENEEKELQKLKKSAEYAQKLNLTVNAGHGLNYSNVKRMQEIQNLYGLNIGHSIIARAFFVGLENAIFEMKALVD